MAHDSLVNRPSITKYAVLVVISLTAFYHSASSIIYCCSATEQVCLACNVGQCVSAVPTCGDTAYAQFTAQSCSAAGQHTECGAITTPDPVTNTVPEEDDSLFDILPGGPAGVAAAGVVALAAVAPPPLAMFPPQGAPQPGAVALGGGALLATALDSPTVAAELSSLVSGINGATVLAVFSSNIPGSFVLPRTVPATATLIAEPAVTTTSRQLSYETSRQQSCGRPVLPLGRKLKTAEKKLSSILNVVSRITKPISTSKSKIYQRLGLACVFPKLLRPFEPILKYARCKLGLEDDGFMDTPPCKFDACREPIIEDKAITHDRGLPNLDYMISGAVSTMDDCFDDMEKVTYGSRVQAKLVDDQSCDDYKVQALCQESIEGNRILSEDDCLSPGCVDPNDDPFRACFGCDNPATKSNYDQYGNFYRRGYQDYDTFSERQTGEVFQTTRQSRRVVCRTGPAGDRRCRLRIDRSMELRRVSYGRALQFVQSERYISDEDINIIR